MKNLMFTIFSALGNKELVDKAAEGIYKDCTVQVLSDVPLDSTERYHVVRTNRRYSWVNKVMLCANKTYNHNKRWFGVAHDDATIAREDFLKLIDAARTADANVHMIGVKQAGVNVDVFALYNTFLYFRGDGAHDPKFNFYYADVDFHIRHELAGHKQLLVPTSSITHIQSHTLKSGAQIYKDERAADAAYFKAKYKSVYDRLGTIYG
jgi:hypothetical protein